MSGHNIQHSLYLISSVIKSLTTFCISLIIIMVAQALMFNRY